MPHLTFLMGARHSHIDFTVNDYFIVPGNPNDSGQQQQHAWSWNIGPATNRQWEVGLRWQQATLQSQWSMFHIETVNEIVVDRSIDGRTTYTNAGLTRRRGVEWELGWQLTPQWHWRMAATWLSADYDHGNRLPGVAEQQLYSQLDWAYRPAQQLSLITEYRGDVVAHDDQSVVAPSHTLWHLNWQGDYEWAQWRIHPWLRWHNLTDAKYVGSVVVNQSNGRAFEPGVGREIQAGLQFRRRY